MKQKFKWLLALVAMVASVNLNADTKTDIMFAKGFGGYTTNSFSAVGTDKSAVANSTNATGVTYAMQVFNGSTGAVRGNQSTATSNFNCRNTTTKDGYYISQVQLTVSSGTIDGSTNNRSVVYFGSSAFTTSPTGTATTASPAKSGQTTLTWTNTDQTVSYFILYNLKTSGTALSAASTTALKVTWTQAVSEKTNVYLTPTPATRTVNVDDIVEDLNSWFTISPENYDGTISYKSSDEDVFAEDEGAGYAFSEGSCNLIITAPETEKYKAANCTIQVIVEAACSNSITITKGTTSNGSFTLSQSGDVCIDEGNASVTVSATPASIYYRLTSVTSKGAGDVTVGTIGAISNNQCTITGINANTTITANFAPIDDYTITLNAGNGSVTDATWTAGAGVWTKTSNQAITLPSATPSAACAAQGWTFVGWSKDNPVNTTTAPTLANAGATTPAANTTYYAVYREGGAPSSTFTKITSEADFTTGDYMVVSNGYSNYAMGNSVTNSRMAETSKSISNDVITNTEGTYIWTLIKLNGKVAFYNATANKYLSITDEGVVSVEAGPQLFSYSYNTTNSRWEFTSPSTHVYNQLVYSTFFKALDAQSTAINLYKRGTALANNWQTNPSCSSYTLSAVADVADGGDIYTTAASLQERDVAFATYSVNDEYNFTGWSISGTGASIDDENAAVVKVTMGSGDATLTANFAAKQYVNVTFKNNDKDLSSLTRSVEIGTAIGELSVLTSDVAEDARSKTFVGWTEDEVNVWQSNKPDLIDASTIINEAKTYNAVWAKEVGVPSTDYSKISVQSDLETNDYVIGYKYKSSGTHFVMKNAVNGIYTTQIAGVAMAPSSNTFANPNSMYIWHFEKQSDGSYTIYNAAVNKYLSASADVVTQEVHLADVGTKFNVINTTVSSQNLWRLQLANATNYYVHGYASGTTYYFKVSDSPEESNNPEHYITLLYKNESTLDYTDYITHSSSSPLASIALNTTGVKTNYFVGESFTSAGLTATATLDDGITFPIEPNDLDITPADLTTAGEKTVTVKYTFNNQEQQAEYKVNAYSVTINSVYTDRVNDESVDGNKYTWTPITGALTFSTQAHYKFNGITNVVGATPTGSDLSYTLSNPTANVTLTATWQRLFTLTYNGKGGSTPTAVEDKTKGTEITLATPSWTGYDFVGWYDNEGYEGEALTSTYSITADAEIFAKWSEIMPASISLSPDVTEITDLIYDDSNKKTKTITATVNPSTALTKTFTWSVVEGADVVSVSSEGLITALKAGSAKVKVASTRDANIYKEISVTVHALPQITWKNMDGTTYASTKGTSAGKVGALPTGTPNSCDEETYPYFRGWSATPFGKTTTNPESGFVTVNTDVELDEEYTFYAVCAAGINNVEEYSFTIQTSDFNTDSYAANNGSHDFTATATKDNSKMKTIACTTFDIMQSSSVMQWRENTGYVFNTTDLGTIKSVTVNSSAGSFSKYYGTSQHPTSGTTVGNGYFTVSVGNATGKTSSIVVTFETGSISYTTWATQCCQAPDEELEITPIVSFKKGQKETLHTTGGNENDVTWSASNGAVTIDEETGEIEGVVVGDVVITAHQDANGDVCEQTAVYNLSVISASEYGILINNAIGGSAVAKNAVPKVVTSAEKDDVITIIATPDDDYNFKGWAVNAGGVTLADASSATTTFTMGEADVEITPSFAKKQFTITLDAGNGKVDDLSIKTLENQDIHSTITLPDAVACNSDEWEFKGWAIAPVTETTTEPTFVSSTEYEVTDNITLYAVYGQGKAVVAGYTISFIDKDNTRQYATGGVSDKVFPVTSNASNAQIFHVSSINQDEATSLTYEGAGGAIYYVYRKTGTNKDFAAATSVPENADIKTWKVTSNSITGVENTQRGIAGRNVNGNTVAAIKDYDVANIGTTYVPIIVEAVYGEGGVWNSNPSCTHHYQVTYDGNGTTTTCTSEKLEEGEITLCADAPVKAGYEFGGWKSSADDQTYTAGATYNLTAPVTFTAVWNPIKVTAITLNVTEPQTLNWKSDLASAPTFQLSVASTTPAAVADNSVTWSVSEGTAVSVSATGLVTAVEAGTATITATANDGSGVTASCTFTVTRTYKLTITDTEGVYDIKANTSTAKNQYHEAAEEITLSGTTKGGYIFGEWVVMQGETPITVTDNKFTMPAAEVTVTATFTTKKDYYVDDMNDNAQIVMEGKYTVPSLPDVVTPSSSNSCEQTHLYFVGWIEGEIDEGQPDVPTGLITAGTENKAASGKTYHAVWAEDANDNQ